MSGEGSGERGLRRLTPPRVSLGPQALVAELHRRALVEYVRPLLRGRLRCRSARTRSRVAGRLREDAAQLQRLFRRLVSAAGAGGLGSETTCRYREPGRGLRIRPSLNVQSTATPSAHVNTGLFTVTAGPRAHVGTTARAPCPLRGG